MDMTLTLTVTLEEDAVECFNTQFCDYIGYWCYVEDDENGKRIVLEHGGEYDIEKATRIPVPDDWIQRGMQVLAQRKYPRLHELLQGDYDCNSLDCLIQAGVLGEIRYG